MLESCVNTPKTTQLVRWWTQSLNQHLFNSKSLTTRCNFPSPQGRYSIDNFLSAPCTSLSWFGHWSVCAWLLGCLLYCAVNSWTTSVLVSSGSLCPAQRLTYSKCSTSIRYTSALWPRNPERKSCFKNHNLVFLNHLFFPTELHFTSLAYPEIGFFSCLYCGTDLNIIH